MSLYDNVRMEFAGFDCSTLEGSVSLELEPSPENVKKLLRESRVFSTTPSFISSQSGGYTATIDGVSFKLDPVNPQNTSDEYYRTFYEDLNSKLFLPHGISDLSKHSLETVLNLLCNAKGILFCRQNLVALNIPAVPFNDFVDGKRFSEFKNNAFFLLDIDLEEVTRRVRSVFGSQPEKADDMCTQGHPHFRVVEGDERDYNKFLYGIPSIDLVGELPVAYARYFQIDPRCGVTVTCGKPGQNISSYRAMLRSAFSMFADTPGVFYGESALVLAANRNKKK